MTILVVSPYLPHDRSGHGTGVFMHGLLSEIAPRHHVTLLSFCSKDEAAFIPDLQQLPLELITVPRGRGAQKNMLLNIYLIAIRLFQLARSVIRWEPFYVSKYFHPRMARYIRELTTDREFDVVQFEMTAMAQYLPYVKKGKTVLHEHDVAFRPAYRHVRHAKSVVEKLFMYIEWCRWSRFERNAGRRFDHVLCVTEQDRLLFRRLTGSEDVSYLPRGVQMGNTFPPFNVREKKTLIFVGTYSHTPNVDAALWLVREIFPMVLKKHPDAILNIVGKQPPAEVRQCALNIPQIKVLGFVDDISALLLKASCFVAPLRFGGGVKIKLLHAIAQGIPIVTTRVGVEGIEGVDGNNVLIAETAEKIAAHVCTIIEDQTRAVKMAEQAWNSVRQHYSWNGVVLKLEEIYNETISRGSSRTS